MVTNASLLDVSSAESTYRRGSGVDLHAVAAGDPDDPLVVLLHGFPDFFYGWRHQIARLVEADYRVLAPDLRGYNLSDKPEDVGSYRLPVVSRDVKRLVEGAESETAHVVGHDWGGVLAWDLALRHPDVVDRLATLNAPHPTVFRETLKTSPRQLFRSWYVLFFQVPELPEWLNSRENYRLLTRALRESAGPETFTHDEIEHYREAWSQEGALTGMINWYRALRSLDHPPRERVEQPTLVLWGEDDVALLPEMASESVSYCLQGDLERYPDASHWVQMDRPREVSERLIDHLSA